MDSLKFMGLCAWLGNVKACSIAAFALKGCRLSSYFTGSFTGVQDDVLKHSK